MSAAPLRGDLSASVVRWPPDRGSRRRAPPGRSRQQLGTASGRHLPEPADRGDASSAEDVITTKMGS